MTVRLKIIRRQTQALACSGLTRLTKDERCLTNQRGSQTVSRFVRHLCLLTCPTFVRRPRFPVRQGKTGSRNKMSDDQESDRLKGRTKLLFHIINPHRCLVS